MSSKTNQRLQFLIDGLNFSGNSLRIKGRPLFFAHAKSSMNPTLWDRDLLEVVPYSRENSVQKGDVIVFPSPMDKTIIAHRAIVVSPTGICTKGDNNGEEDPWRLGREVILGKVVAASRNHNHRKIRGGQQGLLLAKWDHINHRLRAKIKGYLSPIYWAISNSEMLKKFGSRFMNLKAVKFKREEDNDIFLLSGDRVIGKYDARKAAWDINCIYRLFIDEDIFQYEDKLK
jgi:signal peptidase I